MKFLIIGGGSMGKRRARCLEALGHQSLIYDTREDRRQTDNINEKVDGYFVCVPPDKHVEVLDEINGGGKSIFVEASVIKDGLMWHEGSFVCPSATMMFHPSIKALKDRIGTAKVSNIIYHQGMYLPDWHPHEKVSDYYVSNPLTGGAREIVPFELTWITMLFGFPCSVMANYRKTVEIPGAPYIDDTYNILLDYRTFMATMTIEAVSKTPRRDLTIITDKGEIEYDLNEGIGEKMYVEETAAFIRSITDKTPFINTVERDIKVLELLEKIEQSDIEGRRIKV